MKSRFIYYKMTLQDLKPTLFNFLSFSTQNSYKTDDFHGEKNLFFGFLLTQILHSLSTMVIYIFRILLNLTHKVKAKT